MAKITANQAINMTFSGHIPTPNLVADPGDNIPAAGHIFFQFGNGKVVISGSALAGFATAPTLVPGQLELTLKNSFGNQVYNRIDDITVTGNVGVLLSKVGFYNGFTSQNLAGADTITGSAFNDYLLGFSGNDIIEGGLGNDILDGGKGVDTLTGGAGDDVYVVDNVGDKVVELPDEGTDTLVISYNYSLEDIDNIENLTLIDSARIGTGNGEANIITGNASSNTLYGLAGKDTLDGGKGADTLYGGADDDTYVVDNVGDNVVEEANGGTADTVLSSISYSLIDTDGKGDKGGNVENLTLIGRANINATGNNGANELTGNNGNNVLDGGEGGDTLDGGAGSDIYLINAFSDYTLDDKITDKGGSNGIDEIRLAATTLVGDATFTLNANVSGVERVVIGTGTAAKAVTSGKTAFNIDASALFKGGSPSRIGLEIIGNAGVNTLIGTDIADTLDGGKEADMLIGGLGNDYYVVDNADDKVVELIDEGTDAVISSISYSLVNIDGSDSNVENLALTGSAKLTATGNKNDNIIIGNSGNNIINGGEGNDALDGGKGADTLIGGAGDDTYYIDNIADKITENAGEGKDTVKTSVNNYVLGEELEDLTLTGSANINGTGNTLSNVMTGNTGNNVLNGGEGGDTLDGGKGSDIYLINVLSDYTPDDKITDKGSIGTDEIRFAATTLVGNGTFTLNANVSGIERVVIGTGIAAKAVTSGKTAFNIDASAVLNGLTLTGNAGANELTGTAYSDSLNGGVGNDSLIGGLGNDTLDGGRGTDKLDGGAGDDTYIIDNAGDEIVVDISGNDTVKTSLNNYALRDDLENLTLIAGARIGTGNNGNNIITGNAGNNVLTGKNGDDIYVIDNTGDKLVELSDGGNDTVRSSVSYSLEDTDGNGSNGGNIENLSLTGSANINGTGNSLDNIITGNTGKNALIGGAGNDQLNGGGGNDIYLVVSAGDHTTAEIADTGSVSEIDEVRFAATTLSGGSTLTLFAGDTGIERVVIGTGSAASAITSGTTAFNVDASAVLNGLTLTGNSGANTLTGTGFNDILNGGAGIDDLIGGLGNDSLDGGSGADKLNGGDGDDIYIVDTDKDEIIDSSGTDTVKTTVNNYVLGNELENLTLIDGARIGTGNEFDNVIIGNAKNNVLDGGAGNDTLNGDGGNDIYLIVSAGDHTTAEIADTGSASEIDEVRFAATTLSGGNTLTLFAEDTGIERVVIGTGTAASAITSGTTALNVDASAVLKGLIITGNSGANTLTGTAKDDTLNGGAGIDTLVGGLGNDSLGGGVGADTLNGGDGDDTYFVDDNGDVIIDSSGIDTVNTSLLEYILTPDIENLTLLIGAYQGTGNDLENIITGNDGDNILNGDGGIDLLIGGAGNDMLVGGLGADTLVGGLGDDIYGVFLTSVGEMEDTVTEDTAAGSDTIKLAGTSSNLEAVTLRLSANLENLDAAATSASKLNLTGNALNNILTGNAADNILNGGSGNDILKGGNGNDSLYGGDGLDELTGGGGDDTFVFSTAVNKATNADTITDFVSTHDHIQLSKAIFTTLGDAGSLNSDFFYKGTAAHDTTDHIIYDVNTGALYYDSDGTGTAAQVQIVTLTGKPSIVLGDFIIGV